MIVLDTNVLSEMMRHEPHTGVQNWLAVQSSNSIFTTSINQTEILYRVAAMPDGRKKHLLGEMAAAMFAVDFTGRVLSYTSDAAPHYAALVTSRRRAGAPIDAFDALIAAIALATGAALATRDAGFAGCGLVLINPWEP